MGDHERYRIKEVVIDCEPKAPIDATNKFIRQCGVIVRDYIPIIIREWNRSSKDPESLYVSDLAKDTLWKKIMVNFTLPTLEVDPDEEIPTQEELQKHMEQKVKEWALRKMA